MAWNERSLYYEDQAKAAIRKANSANTYDREIRNRLIAEAQAWATLALAAAQP